MNEVEDLEYEIAYHERELKILRDKLADPSLVLRAIGTCRTCEGQDVCDLTSVVLLQFCDRWRKREE